MALALMAQAATAKPLLDPVTVAPAPIVVEAPNLSPMHDAVQACDRDAMTRLNKAEPHRRAEFSMSIYAEQRAIAAERARLAPVGTAAAGKASLEIARATIEARQKRLDDARATEQAWRTAVDELRADFLANCERKHD